LNSIHWSTLYTASDNCIKSYNTRKACETPTYKNTKMFICGFYPKIEINEYKETYIVIHNTIFKKLAGHCWSLLSYHSKILLIILLIFECLHGSIFHSLEISQIVIRYKFCSIFITVKTMSFWIIYKFSGIWRMLHD